MSLPTVTDLKVHLNMTSTAHDDELADMLESAVDVVEGIVGPITAQTVSETHRGAWSDVLLLRRTPVVDLLSVSSRSGASITPLVSGDFELDAEAGLLRRVDGYGFSGSFTVTYSVGRPSVPAGIRTAILIIAGHLWETQRGTSPTALALQQQSDVDPSFGGTAGYAIPNRARELLQRYVRTASIA